MPRGRKPKKVSDEPKPVKEKIKKPKIVKEKVPRIRSEKWIFTLPNYTDNDWNEICEFIPKNCCYGIVGKEIAPTTGTPHLQGYFRFETRMDFTRIQKIFNSRAHVEKANADDLHNQQYCSKEGHYFEHGKPRKQSQGMRNDLKRLHNSINDGKRVKEIRQKDPHLYHMYGRTLEKLESDRLRDFIRTEMPTCIWYYGPTGTGKSHRALKNMTPFSHYIVPNDNGWWDCYEGQDTIVFNDFRGSFPFSDLLQLCDKYNYYVKRRNRDPYPVSSSTIIITTALPPEKVYKNLDKEDSMSQLYRRFKVFQCIDWTTTIERTFDNWCEESVHYSRIPGPGFEQDDSD